MFEDKVLEILMKDENETNPDKHFLLSLVGDMADMNPSNKRKFKKEVLSLIDNILVDQQNNNLLVDQQNNNLFYSGSSFLTDLN